MKKNLTRAIEDYCKKIWQHTRLHDTAIACGFSYGSEWKRLKVRLRGVWECKGRVRTSRLIWMRRQPLIYTRFETENHIPDWIPAREPEIKLNPASFTLREIAEIGSFFHSQEKDKSSRDRRTRGWETDPFASANCMYYRFWGRSLLFSLKNGFTQ